MYIVVVYVYVNTIQVAQYGTAHKSNNDCVCQSIIMQILPNSSCYTNTSYMTTQTHECPWMLRLKQPADCSPMRFVSIHMRVHVSTLIIISMSTIFMCFYILFRYSYINCYFLYRIRLLGYLLDCILCHPLFNGMVHYFVDY